MPHDGLKVFLYSDPQKNGTLGQEIDNTVPNTQGIYDFNDVPNGNYVLKVRPVGDLVVADTDKSIDPYDIVDAEGNGQIPVFLQRGENDADNDFLLVFESTASNASISGKVLVDTDGDGIGDTGYYQEYVLLNLRGPNGLPISDGSFEEKVFLTQLDGSFYFDNIPEGEYVLTSTGNFMSSAGLVVFTRVSDKDESPEASEALDTGIPDGHIIVDLEADGQDSDNNFVIRF